MNQKSFFGMVLLVFLFPVSVSAVPILNVTGGAPAVFGHDEFSLIPDGESRSGTVASTGNFVDMETTLSGDYYFKTFRSEGVDGDFNTGGINLSIITGGVQSLLSGTGITEIMRSLNQGTNLFMETWDYYNPGTSFSLSFLGAPAYNNMSYPDITMSVANITDSMFGINVDLDGSGLGKDGWELYVSSSPIPDLTPVSEPTVVTLLTLGLLSLVYARTRRT